MQSIDGYEQHVLDRSVSAIRALAIALPGLTVRHLVSKIESGMVSPQKPAKLFWETALLFCPITNQLLYQLSYAGILRAETPPSAAISILTVYAIFYGMPVGCMEHKHRCAGLNAVLAIIENPLRK